MNLEEYPNVYIHNPNVIFPDIDNQHIVIKKPKYEFVYDDKFAYRKTDRSTLIKRFWLKLFTITIANLITRIRYSLKIKGKENIKQYKKICESKGILSVCNHTAEWDLIMSSIALGYVPEFPIWKEGAESTLGDMMRTLGGIVVPKGEIHGLVYSFNAMRDVLREGKNLHVFPEAACWPFYPAVRNFEMGTFKLAYEFQKPILPLAVKYRKPKGLYKLFKKEPNASISIGEPVLCNYDLPKLEAMQDLQQRVMSSVMKLLGINSPEDNTKIRELIQKIHSNISTEENNKI